MELPKENTGFTLIEIMTVLMILGVLLTISIPMFMVHTQRARAAEAVATLGLIREQEREYFARHNTYLSVASPNLPNAPDNATNPGLGINVSTAQGFSNSAYSVEVPGSSVHFTTAPTVPVDFVIKAQGSSSVQCSGSITDCAVRQSEVANYQLEMDNSWRVFICYNNCANAANWQSWSQ